MLTLQVSEPDHSNKECWELTMCRESEGRLASDGKLQKAFLTGGNSTCHTHICQHYDLYKKRCKKKNILENHHALPRSLYKKLEEEKGHISATQPKIVEMLEPAPRPQQFSRDMLLHAEAQFIVCDDQALTVANKATFRNCLVAMRPKTLRVDLPSTHEVTMYIHNKFIMWLKELKTDIEVSYNAYSL